MDRTRRLQLTRAANKKGAAPAPPKPKAQARKPRVSPRTVNPVLDTISWTLYDSGDDWKVFDGSDIVEDRSVGYQPVFLGGNPFDENIPIYGLFVDDDDDETPFYVDASSTINNLMEDMANDLYMAYNDAVDHGLQQEYEDWIQDTHGDHVYFEGISLRETKNGPAWYFNFGS